MVDNRRGQERWARLWRGVAMMGLVVPLALACTSAPAAAPTAAPAAAPPKAAAPAPTAAAAVKPAAAATTAPAAAPATPAFSETAVYEAAKKEGKVLVYTSTQAENQKGLAAKFKEKYPGIEVEWWSGRNGAIQERVLAESRASRDVVDVLFDGVGDNVTLMESGLIEPFDAPAAASFIPELKDPKKLWTVVYIAPQGVIYNKDLVKGADVPKGWNDLLDPKWKGKVAHQKPYPGNAQPRWWMTMGRLWGQDRLKAYATGLAKQSPMLFNGPEVAQNVSVGEYSVGVTWVPHIYSVCGKDSPCEYVRDQPLSGLDEAAFLVKKAPHPNAARLFFNFMMTPEGQKVNADLGYAVASPALQSAIPDLAKLKVVPFDLPPQKDIDKFIDEFLKPIFG